jgi:2-polyprenyl-3-methyl-5-hydroxy-6-metoxy-1,4-benzoquinol methylase
MTSKIYYETYQEWKQWEVENHLEPWLARYFSKEIGQARLHLFSSVLEIGFGNGEFLEWVKTRGAVAVGLEIIPELVKAVSECGFEVYHWNLVEDDEAQNPIKGRQFDCIVAFDVLEHFTIEEAQYALARMAKLLAPKGKIILRFPNGASPFYLPLQNGDYTHRISLTKPKLEHLCINTSLQLESYRNSARIANKRITAPLKWCFFRFRDAIEILLGYTYYGRRIPLDPAATAVLAHK